MIVDDLLKNPGSWLSMGREPGIAVSSRVRLARNVKGSAFPGWAGEAERTSLCDRLSGAVGRLAGMPNALFLDMGATTDVDKQVLKERHLISLDLCEKSSGSALMLSADERIAIMINEEDHLRLQVMSPGFNLDAVWNKIDSVDTELESSVEYAFSPSLGYLTACPSNVGTGLRASVMLHLSGLRIMDEIDAVLKGLGTLGYEIRGLFGEGTDAWGNMFQVSNRSTLGESEQDIVSGLKDVTDEVIRHERNARVRAVETKECFVRDHVGRAYGILRHARLLSSREAADILSALSLGVEMGLVTGVELGRINRVMLLTQPGHLQKMAGKLIDTEERDKLRASVVREQLAGVTLKD